VKRFTAERCTSETFHV